MDAEHAQASLYEVTLPEALDLRAALPLANSLLSARGGAIRLDGSQVKTVGAQCMQVILSARHTWERDGLPLTIINPTEDLLNAFVDAGLSIEGLVEGEQGK
ncbi:STAS domain-containing protein [Methylocystis echinoides]|jgi:chemotaxis protein CheX|uniref:STAS domain-containing protein n=1 Tax=Methylocystis echinoides TaxID=29468 RepID=UPI003444AE6F